MSRFYIHKAIANFADDIVAKHGLFGEKAMIYPSIAVALRCTDFFLAQVPSLGPEQVRIIEFVSEPSKIDSDLMNSIPAAVTAILFPEKHFKIAKAFWQHTGEGISSRQAEYCHRAFKTGILVAKIAIEGTPNTTHKVPKGPKRYRNPSINS